MGNEPADLEGDRLYTENDPAFEAILDAMEGGSAFEVITQYIKETPSGQKIQMKRIF